MQNALVIFLEMSLCRPILLFKTIQTLQRYAFVLVSLWIGNPAHLGILELRMKLQQYSVWRSVELHAWRGYRHEMDRILKWKFSAQTSVGVKPCIWLNSTALEQDNRGTKFKTWSGISLSWHYLGIQYTFCGSSGRQDDDDIADGLRRGNCQGD